MPFIGEPDEDITVDDVSTWAMVGDFDPEDFVAAYFAAGFDPALIAEVEHFEAVSPDGWSSREFLAIIRLLDGSYVVVSSWCDTTGWDCRSGGAFTRHPDREHAERFGLDDEQRGRLGISLE